MGDVTNCGHDVVVVRLVIANVALLVALCSFDAVAACIQKGREQASHHAVRDSQALPPTERGVARPHPEGLLVRDAWRQLWRAGAPQELRARPAVTGISTTPSNGLALAGGDASVAVGIQPNEAPAQVWAVNGLGLAFLRGRVSGVVAAVAPVRARCSLCSTKSGGPTSARCARTDAWRCASSSTLFFLSSSTAARTCSTTASPSP